MAKYGLFAGNVKDPLQTYDGDKMLQNGDYVYIYKTGGEQVAAVKLGEGQCVKKIE